MVQLLLRFCAGLALLAPVLAGGEPITNAVLAPHARDLVVLRDQTLVPFNPQYFLQAPYTILYFGAGWCPDCIRFSPALVEAYARQGRGAKHFEVLFLSQDKSAEGMLQFMRSEKMTWPALAFEKIERAPDLARFYSGKGIPCLTLINREGKILLQSKDDQDAKNVLKQAESLMK